jgi:hypothetical protein
MRAVRKGVNNVKDGQEKAKKKLEEKLEKLKAFDASSPSIFSEIATLESAVNAGAGQAANCWNAGQAPSLCPKKKIWLGQHMSMHNGTSEQLRKVTALKLM